MPTYARYSGVGGGGIQSINNSTVPAQQIVAGTGINVGTVVGTGITTITNTSPMAATGNLTEATSAVLTISGGTGCVIGSGTTIQVLQSSAIQSGYLSSGDWSTFNNKVSSVGASAPISSTGGTTPSISISQSSALSDGYLSSTDWNTFNNKQNALSFGNLTGDTNANISISGGTGAVIGAGTSVSQSAASTTANGYLSSTDWNTFNNKANSTLNNLTSPTAINQSLLFNPDATYDIGADGASRPAAIHASSHVTAPTIRARDNVVGAGQHDITVRGGDGLTGNKDGGVLTLAGGVASGSGQAGYVVVKTANTERARFLGDGTVGIGISAPSSPLEIQKQGSVVVLPMLSINKFDNGGLGILGATIQAKTARGTAISPSAVATSDELLSLKMSAYDSSTYQTYDAIKSVASATWNGSQNPFRTIFYSAENTTAKQRLSIEPNGELQIKGDTSGYVGISSPAAPTSYSLVLPTAQGAASSVLQNDGSGNLSWVVANLPSQTGNSGKFLITDGTNASWDTVVNEGGLSTIDFRVEGDTDANLLFTDASADNVGIGTNAPGAKLDVRGSVIINEAGGDNDVRIEGDTDVNLLFTDASTDRVGIGNNAPTAKLDVTGNIIASADIQSTSQNGGQLAGTRNRIINGAMQIDQRNAGAAITLTTTAGYPVDRFAGEENTDGTMDAEQVEDAPAGFYQSIKFTTTTADATIGSTQYVVAFHRIEGSNVNDLNWGTANAKQVTLSFWVKSSLTGTFGGSLQNSASNRSYPFTYTINSANTWENKSVTISGDTTGTWLQTNGTGIQIAWGLGVGSTYSGTAGAWAGSNFLSATGAVSVIGTLNATWFITGVQFEVGPVATSFEWRGFQQELAMCQRYYEKSFNLGTAPAQNAGSTGAVIVTQAGTGSGLALTDYISFKVAKRANPGTVTTYNPSAANAQVYDFSNAASWTLTATNNISQNGFNIAGTAVAGSATGATVGVHWSADAEL